RAWAHSRWRTAPSTTPIPPIHADSTASGACTSGSTAPPRGATRRASGGAATTSTTGAEGGSRTRVPRRRVPAASWWTSTAGQEDPATMGTVSSSQKAFIGVSALLFAASAAVTAVWCASMSAMGGMRMPGGWTMSMAWMLMPGQTWFGAAASFVGMWAVMMVAMMLPSLVPMLWRYRQAVGRTGETRLGLLTVLVGVGYFCVWIALGMAVFPLGV